MTNNLIDQNRKRFPEIAQLCEDSLAILVEYPSASLVRVSNISSDDWGVKFKVTFVPTPGLSLPRKTNRPSGDLSAAWEIFSFGAGVWSARYVAWRLHFAPELVEKVCLVAGQIAEQGNQIDFRDIAKCTPKLLTLVLATASPIALAQVPNPQLSFDVAAIHQDTTSTDGHHHIYNNPGESHLRTVNVSLKELLEFAYGMPKSQILGGPPWLDSVTFDVDAKGDATVDTQLHALPLIRPGTRSSSWCKLS